MYMIISECVKSDSLKSLGFTKIKKIQHVIVLNRMFIPGRNGPRPAYSNFFYIILIGFDISKGSGTPPPPAPS